MKKLITAFLFLSTVVFIAPAFAGNAHSTWCFHHPVACQEQNRHRNWDRDGQWRRWWDNDHDRDDQWRHEHHDWDNDRWEKEHNRRSWNWDNHHEHHDWDHDHDRD